jgi:transposase
VSAPKHRTAQPREILAREAAALRAEGLNGMRIAERLRISRSYAYELLSDPTGDLERERKARYYGTCEECGAQTSYRTGGCAELCRSCAVDERTIWTADAIVYAIQEFADESGGIPPTATEWNFTLAKARGLAGPERDLRWPLTQTVVNRFGTWNAAIAAAGFEPRSVGHYGRDGEDPAVIDETIALYRSGMELRQVAAHMDCSYETVRHRIARAGEPLRISMRSVRAAERRAAICEMWADDCPLSDIAEQLGTTVGSIASTIAQMRAQGYDLPYRNPRSLAA